MKVLRSLAILAAAAGCLAAQQEPSAKSGLADLSVVPPAMACADLMSAEIAMPPDATLRVTSATLVEDSAAAPYCRVLGVIAPEVKIEVRLPVKTWTQRFLMTGCGGLCGNLNIRVSNASGCAPAENGELALASTDMGHSGGMDGSWAAGHPERIIDFAYRGIHVTAIAAKTIIGKFYGRQPRFSYFAGCSDGGREALMEAERYPEDFDGITAGAAAMNFITQNTFYHGWNATINRDADGQIILTAAQLPVLHAAVIEACDALDGLKDGLIGNPTLCHFDPQTIVCKDGQKADACLTPQQAKVAAEIYRGAHDEKGRQLVLSGPMYGSELAWQGVFIPRGAAGQTMSAGAALGTFRYLTSWQPKAERTLADLHYEKATLDSFVAMHEVTDATDPDLSPFAKQNRKLILWHGWSDPHISPLNSIVYYTAMEKIMGESAVQKFARLYLFPGGAHCGGGEGPFNVDLQSAIMAWVETGAAPDGLIASHTKGGGPPPMSGQMRQGPVDRTRPVYPYPQTAVYKGSGSIDEAANFNAAPGPRIAAAKLEWLGAGFYSAGFQKWCSVVNEKPTCSSRK
jgi:feruloyl esterase